MGTHLPLTSPLIAATIAHALLDEFFQQAPEGLEESLHGNTSLTEHLKPGEETMIQFGFPHCWRSREATRAIFAQGRRSKREQTLITPIRQFQAQRVEHTEQFTLVKFRAPPAYIFIFELVSIKNQATINL